MNKLLTIFLILSITLTVFSYAFVDPGLGYFSKLYSGIFLSHRQIVTLVFVLVISLFYAIYALSLLQINKGKINLSTLKKFLAVSLFVLFFSYPAVVSYDIFNYTTTAEVLFGYLENPYVVMPIEFEGNQFLSYTHAANKTALYGPFWLLLTGIPFLAFSWNFIIMLFAFKLIPVTFYILLLIMIHKETKNYLPVLFFGMNPLVIFETFVGGHNDVVMIFFALLSLVLIKKGMYVLSWGALLLSFLIKFATIFLLPLYPYIFWKKIKGSEIDWSRIYLFAGGLMSIIFFLSPIREEMYPWYFIWVLVFVALTKNLKLYILVGFFSFFLLMRYVPYMYIGDHFGITPYLKIGITFGPLFMLAGIMTYLSIASGKKRTK